MTTTTEEPKTKKRPDAAGTKTASEQLNALKTKLDDASGRAKETIRATIDACTKQYQRAVEANKEYVEELRAQMKDTPADTSHLDEISGAFANSLQISEEVIDAIIDSHLRRVNQLVDFNKKSMETLHKGYATDNFNYDEFVDLLQKNFDRNVELSTQDMKRTVEVYNKHVNLSVNFNKRFSNNVNRQIDALVKFQTKGIEAYSNWMTNWWKEDK